MSQITFLASSKPFLLPMEIEEYNHRKVFEHEEDMIFFSVEEADDNWKEQVKGLFSVPYIYEAQGVGNRLFLTYIEKYLNIGDVLEIYQVPDQHALEEYKQGMKESPEPIKINIGRGTYQTIYGTYQLNPKKWVEELSCRRYLTSYGVTTFVND